MRFPRWAYRAAFAAFALLLFTLTHWPRLKVPGPGRTDLIAHAAAFGLWTSLLISCAFFGPVLSRANIVRCVLIAVVYAAFDESTQAIPWLGRYATFEDYLFNLVGIAGAGIGAFVLARITTGRPRTNPA